jgi:phosphoribosylformimino-5-aminoimidazole carboxamide ribotide isomerase
VILFPAIDLKQGQCVRLKLGEMASATVYNEDPAAQAKAFEDQGFAWLHVVDLDGAFAGESRNGEAVEAILKATNNPCSSAAASAPWRISRHGWKRGWRA